MNRNGFTLVELLIVVVILGILAAIAIPKFAATKEKAYIATMKTDLRNLAPAQEAYFYDFDTYYNGPVPDPGFQYATSSKNVTITLQDVSATGWAAVATYAAVLNTCTIFYGAAPPPPPAVVEGSPACN